MSGRGGPGRRSRIEGLRARAAARAATVAPGVAVCLVVAAAAQFLADHYGAPQMLFALLIGMALHFLVEDPRCAPGIAFASSVVLRLGVALLGARITLAQVVALGLEPVLWMTAGVFVTIALGVIASAIMGCGRWFGVLSGGSVGICGASAALAIASVLPPTPELERRTLFVVLAVTTLSTLAMIAYPVLAAALDLSLHDAGLFFGATIHDVAQVVGAGYGVSVETGDVATITKLFRVMLLVPVVLGVGLAVARLPGRAARAHGFRGLLARAPLPLFIVAFCLLVAVNSVGAIPDALQVPLVDASRWCLVTAIAALGIKTSLKSLASLGYAPLLLMVLETAFLAGWALAGLLWVV